MINKLIKLAIKYRVVLFSLAVMILFGYSLWRIQSISDPMPNSSYLESKRSGSPSARIQIKDSVKSQIEQLQDTPVNVQPGQLGKPDPFNP